MKTSKKRIALRLWVGISLCFAILGASGYGFLVYADSQFENIPTFSDLERKEPAEPFDVETKQQDLALSADISGEVNYLVFSTGTTNITDEDARKIGVTNPDERGSDELTDVLMIVNVNPVTEKISLISIPRDTWIAKYDHKLNALYPIYGVQTLVDEVSDYFDTEIHHVVHVNMLAFVQLTDSVGGVNLWIDHDARDLNTGLSLKGGQTEYFDGERALQWVRSRQFEEHIDGTWKKDFTGDFGRMRRQHQLLLALVEKLNDASTLTKIPDILETAQGNLIVDEDLSLDKVLNVGRLVLDYGAENVQTWQVPGEPGWVGEASVVFVDREASQQLLDDLSAGIEPDLDPTN